MPPFADTALNHHSFTRSPCSTQQSILKIKSEFVFFWSGGGGWVVSPKPCVNIVNILWAVHLNCLKKEPVADSVFLLHTTERWRCRPMDLPAGENSTPVGVKPEDQYYIQGETVTYVCEASHTPAESTMFYARCQASGNWTAGNLRCVLRTDCKSLGPISLEKL